MTKFWMINQKTQETVVATEFENIEEAYQASIGWNRQEDRPSMWVDLVSNAKVPAQATQIKAVYQMQMSS